MALSALSAAAQHRSQLVVFTADTFGPSAADVVDSSLGAIAEIDLTRPFRVVKPGDSTAYPLAVTSAVYLEVVTAPTRVKPSLEPSERLFGAG